MVAAELDPGRRRRLAGRAESARLPVCVIADGVPGLPFEPASFDSVVCTVVLCTVPDLPGALAELRLLLTADGQLLFLEHVLARTALGPVQQAIAPLCARAAGGFPPGPHIAAPLRAA